MEGRVWGTFWHNGFQMAFTIQIVCETIPTLAALAQARPRKRLPRAFPASSKSPFPHPIMVAQLVMPTLCRWRQKYQFKAHLGYQKTISKNNPHSV